MATIRSLAIANLKAALETISVANGYAANLSIASGGGGVYLWRTSTQTEVAVPFVVISALSEQHSFQNSSHQTCSMNVQIECFDAYADDSGDTGWDRMDVLLGAIQKAVMVSPYRGQSKNTVLDTQIESNSIKPWDQDDGVLVGTCNVTITYRTAWADPGTAPT